MTRRIFGALLRRVQGRLVGAVTPFLVLPDSPKVRSFLEHAVTWHRTESHASLARVLRSRHSGVPHDAAAAYATLAARTESLLDAIERGQLALPTSDRDPLLRFVARMRRIRAIAPGETDVAIARTVAELFELIGRNDADLHAGQVVDASEPIALTDPLPAEEPAGVAPWQKHFSASALNTYVECPRKWFYKYACAAVEDPGSSASAYGSAFHLALEDFHGEYPRPSNDDEAAMRRRIRECVTWAFERNRNGFETQVEFELQVRRAQRTAQRYVDWLLVQAKNAPFEVIGREVAAEISLHDRPFIGYIDRLDRDERTGGIRVVDYKTGSIATSPAEYAEKVRAYADFQLPFYYWARTAAGDRVTHLVLIPLRDALLDVRPVVLAVGSNISVADLERSRSAMAELGDQLASGTIRHFKTAADASPCTYCSYALACAAKPPQQPPRFGS